jgi:hypothetical protein
MEGLVPRAMTREKKAVLLWLACLAVPAAAAAGAHQQQSLQQSHQQQEERTEPPLPTTCPGEDAFEVTLDPAATYNDVYLRHRTRIWEWAQRRHDVAFDCQNATVAALLYKLRNSSTQALMVGNGPPDPRITDECFDAFEEVIRFNDFSQDYGSRTTVHVVNAVVNDYSPDAWVVLSLECVAPFVQEEPRFCMPSAEARAVLCSSPPEVRDAGSDEVADDDPSRGFLFAALFARGLRLTGFTDDGAHAPGTDDEGGEHLLDAHHICEEHYVMKVAQRERAINASDGRHVR